MPCETFLCYGLALDPGKLATMMGITQSKAVHCVFCGVKSNKQNKFCPNCGHSLDIGPNDIPAMEVVELVSSAGGKPPVGIEVFCADGRVCICHVLGKGIGFSMMSRPPGSFPWKNMSDIIKSYVQMLCVKFEVPEEENRPTDAWEPTIFFVSL